MVCIHLLYVEHALEHTCIVLHLHVKQQCIIVLHLHVKQQNIKKYRAPAVIQLRQPENGQNKVKIETNI